MYLSTRSVFFGSRERSIKHTGWIKIEENRRERERERERENAREKKRESEREKI